MHLQALQILAEFDSIIIKIFKFIATYIFAYHILLETEPFEVIIVAANFL